MRISTKIKHLTAKYRVEISLKENGFYIIKLFEDHTGEQQTFEGMWTDVISDAYKHFNKVLAPQWRF